MDGFGNHHARKNKPDLQTNMQGWRDGSEPSGKRMGDKQKARQEEDTRAGGWGGVYNQSTL